MLFISTNHKTAPEYPQRVLAGNFIWNTLIIPVVGELELIVCQFRTRQPISPFEHPFLNNNNTSACILS